MTKKINLNWVSGLLISFLFCAFFAALLSFKTMPISEGWYSEYAWMINHGKLPYRDFEYLFFPLYMFIIAGFTSVFGYSIIALRILGVFVFAGIGAVLYCIFAKLFDNLSGTVAAIVTALFLQSEVGQLFYDYIRFHDLFAMAAAYFLLRVTVDCYNNADFAGRKISVFTGVFAQYIAPAMFVVNGIVGLIAGGIFKNLFRTVVLGGCVVLGMLMITASIGFKKTNAAALRASSIPFSAVLCGIFVSMECMVKQSNGMLMIILVSVYFIFCGVTLRNKSFFRAFWGAAAGAVVAFGILFIYLLATNTLDDFWRCCFGTALNAKGGLMKALFGWIPGNVKQALNKRELLIVVLTIYAAYLLFKKRSSSLRKGVFAWIVMILFAGIMAVASWTFCSDLDAANRFYGRNDSYIPALVYFPCAFAFFLMALCLLWNWVCKKQTDGIWERLLPLFPVLGVIFAQGYGSGMSGGLATSQTAMSIGMITAFCLHSALRTKAKVLTAWVLSAALFLSCTFVSRKTVQYYDWWGLTQGSITEHTVTADVPMLKGIKMRETDKICYETVYNDIIENTDMGDTIFVFPHAPVFYTMTDRHSVTYSQVQWFDVSSPASIDRDIQALRENPPKMMVYVTLPEFVYEGHENAFATYQTRKMRDFIQKDFAWPYGYVMLSQVDIGNGYFVTTYLLQE